MQRFLQMPTQLLDGILLVFIGMQCPLSYATYGRFDIEFLTFVDDTEIDCSAAGQFWFGFNIAAKPP